MSVLDRNSFCVLREGKADQCIKIYLGGGIDRTEIDDYGLYVLTQFKSMRCYPEMTVLVS